MGAEKILRKSKKVPVIINFLSTPLKWHTE